MTPMFCPLPLLRGLSLHTSIQQGCELAGRVVQQSGALVPVAETIVTNA